MILVIYLAIIAVSTLIYSRVARIEDRELYRYRVVRFMSLIGLLLALLIGLIAFGWFSLWFLLSCFTFFNGTVGNIPADTLRELFIISIGGGVIMLIIFTANGGFWADAEKSGDKPQRGRS